MDIARGSPSLQRPMLMYELDMLAAAGMGVGGGRAVLASTANFFEHRGPRVPDIGGGMSLSE
jgi:hypothetical protein